MKTCERCGEEFGRRRYPGGTWEDWIRFSARSLCWDCYTHRTCALDGCNQEFHVVANGFSRRYCTPRCAKRAVYVTKRPPPRLAPVEPFRQKLEEAQIPTKVVALRLGWMDHRGRPDSMRVKRTLGLKPYDLGRGRGNQIRENVQQETAERLGDVLGVDRWEWDEEAA